MAQNLKIIKNRTTFIHIKNNGVIFKGKCFNINYLDDSTLENVIFVGYIVTKRIGNAVKRNKAKRLMIEIARKVLLKYGKINSYYVLIAKNPIFKTNMNEQENQLKDLISWL